ncbi:hypothetical protein BP6252_03047 [Coleophoma cylindrospora]|uniref:Ribosomal RNA-processing protein 7 n=1 Tax=Coleophoma cylindrospora TaxID=1849047 RepID=A0A3D8S6J1_9HELO|nr:hypothetical protein BP6252_03047 [Coleophoma cylindrospora]
MSKIPSTIADYAVLPIAIPPTPAYQVKTTHHVYVRPHAPKLPTVDDSRSLFLVNVPVDSTSPHFRAVFASLVGAGRFESITFENERKNAPSSAVLAIEATRGKKRKRASEADVELDTGLPPTWDRALHKSGSTAVAVFADEKSAEAVLKAIKKLHKSGKGAFPVWGEGLTEKVPKLGSHRYLTHHKMQYPDPDLLRASVDAYMMEFNRKEEEASQKAKRMRNVPDEDGFVTVTRGGRSGPARRDDAETKRLELEEKEEKKRKEMGDFYRFQLRERRKEEQGELVKRFEEDRKRVDAMKEKRGKFRPEK